MSVTDVTPANEVKEEDKRFGWEDEASRELAYYDRDGNRVTKDEWLAIIQSKSG